MKCILQDSDSTFISWLQLNFFTDRLLHSVQCLLSWVFSAHHLLCSAVCSVSTSRLHVCRCYGWLLLLSYVWVRQFSVSELYRCLTSDVLHVWAGCSQLQLTGSMLLLIAGSCGNLFFVCWGRNRSIEQQL